MNSVVAGGSDARQVPKRRRSCRPETKKGYLCCCAACSCGLTAILVLVVLVVLGSIGGSGITALPADTRADATDDLDPSNVMRVTWLPGCWDGNKTDEELDECGGTCFDSSLIAQIEGFYAQNGFRMVNFSSRAGPLDGPEGQNAVEIKAWYIPPAPGVRAGPGTPPRVVVQHGTNQNQNKFEAQIAGFLLASAGFGVLLPSLRDHGYSGASRKGLFSWGWEYPYDLLGAWDYAKDDPDGMLGGALPADQVGVMGFSMGGFTAVNAFGMEGDIPAVWADAPVFSVKDILLFELRKVVSFLGDLSINFAWAFGNQVVQLHFNHPAKVLPDGPSDRRKVFLVHNNDDTTVPTSQIEDTKRLLEEHPDKYRLQGTWFTSADCNGDTHRVFPLLFPSEYRQKLCSFWTEAFGMSQDQCANAAPIGSG